MGCLPTRVANKKDQALYNFDYINTLQSKINVFILKFGSRFLHTAQSLL